MVEFELESYRTAFFALIIPFVFALMLVIYSMRNANWPAATIRLYSAYFFVGSLGWLWLAFDDGSYSRADFTGSLAAVFVCTYILFLAVCERAREFRLAWILGILHLGLVIYVATAREIELQILVVSWYGIVIWSVIGSILIHKAITQRNAGHLVIAAGAFLYIIGSGLQIYLLKTTGDLGAVASVMISDNAMSYMLVGIGFLSTVLLAEHRQLSMLALNDPLTGLLNRRGLEQALYSMTALANRQEKPISAIAMDIDYFKRINDTYGHDGGDKVLQSLADMLSGRLRGSDICCRLGGEEFVIVLPFTRLNDAATLAEQLRSSIEDMEVKHGKAWIRFTVSLGVSCQEESFHLDSLLKDADKMLYMAKGAGRNRLVRPDETA